MKNIALSIFATLVLAACTTTSSVAPKVGKKQADISNTEWTLEENVKGKVPKFTLSDDKISGNAGCNNFTGDLSLQPTTGDFSASNIAMTKMACNNHSSEKNFITMLNATNKYVVNGDVLELYKDNLLLLRLHKK